MSGGGAGWCSKLAYISADMLLLLHGALYPCEDATAVGHCHAVIAADWYWCCGSVWFQHILNIYLFNNSQYLLLTLALKCVLDPVAQIGHL